MLRRTYDSQLCSIARTLEVVGERWTFLIVRDALLGANRFDTFLTSLGIARNVLADRLNSLIEHGVFERVPYQDRPLRHEYRLTTQGRELTSIILSHGVGRPTLRRRGRSTPRCRALWMWRSGAHSSDVR